MARATAGEGRFDYYLFFGLALWRLTYIETLDVLWGEGQSDLLFSPVVVVVCYSSIYIIYSNETVFQRDIGNCERLKRDYYKSSFRVGLPFFVFSLFSNVKD